MPCTALLAILFYPESPNFLVSQNKPEAAKAALKRFRGSTCNVEAELNTLVNFSLKNNVHKLHGWKGRLHKILEIHSFVLDSHSSFAKKEGSENVIHYHKKR